MSRTDSTIIDWRRDPWDEPEDVEPEDMEPLPPERKGGRRLGLAFLAILVVLAVLAGLAGRWAIQQVAPPGSPGDPVTSRSTWATPSTAWAPACRRPGSSPTPGSSAGTCSARGPRAQARLLRPAADGRHGERRAALRTSPTQTFTNVTFPEGYAVARMGARLEKTVPRLTAANFVAAATSGQIQSELAPGVDNLEGLLFPDSYQIGGSETEAQIVSRLSQQMTRVANSVGIQNSQGLVGRSPYEVLVVASMIEKEAKVDEDRALIARVIYNRLFVGTPLQIDATLYYGQDSATPFSTLQATDTPYNTYLHLGLPPTPITNPGKKSIEAALHPAPNPDPATCPGGQPCIWLYYVLADKSGRHAFATTYEDHLKNVAKARAAGLLG